MTSCRIVDLSFSHDGASPLLEGVSQHLTAGWYGLVGENGAGKTTLLRLLSGELQPDAGSVRWQPAAPRIVLCVQDVESPPEGARSLPEGATPQGARWRGRLGLRAEDLERWNTLSPGERKRWQVGAALAMEPDVLLLDEPSNHLDAEARDVLCAALREFSGIGVVVSHQRDLLEALTDATLRVRRGPGGSSRGGGRAGAQGGTVRQYVGAYGEAQRQWEAEERERRSERERLQGELRKAEKKLEAARRRQEAASGQLSARKRMKNRHDNDARSILARNRVSFAETRHGQSVGVHGRELERARDAVAGVRVEKERGGEIFVDYVPCPRRQLCALDEPVLRAGSEELLRDVRLVLGREDRVHLRGPNGVGKTTLLTRLLEAAALPAERCLYVPQELDSAARRELAAEVRALPADVRGRVLSVAATLGLDPAALLSSAQPSPGEARKVALALGLGRQVWLLALDEPTNHLDLPSIERIERALADYPGALLLVSHDESFAARCTERCWELRGGRVWT